MGRLEHRDITTDVAGRGEPQPTDLAGEGVADHVTEEIAGDDDAIILGILGEPHGLRIDIGRPQRIALYSLCTSLATSSIIPEVSRRTLGFSQMVTDL